MVVGELYGIGHLGEAGLLGEAPNLAARLQAVADPGAMVIADTTRELIGNLFECQALPSLALKGFSDPVLAYSVAARARGREPLSCRARGQRRSAARGTVRTISRRFQDGWQRAAAGQGTAVLLLGEAGIGKSRLMLALSDEVARGAGLTMTLSCQPQFANTALQPVLALLRRSAGIQSDNSPEMQFRKLGAVLDGQPGDGPALRALFAAMLKIPPTGSTRRRPKAPAATPGLLRGDGGAGCRAWPQGAPALLCVEDLHWADPTTLEFVAGLLDGIDARPMLLLATARPDAGIALTEDPRVEVLGIERLDPAAVGAIVTRVTEGLHLAPEVQELIDRQSDGNPLFVEELTKSLLQSGQLRAESGRLELADPLARIATPPTLHDSLMARLDRLAAARSWRRSAPRSAASSRLDLMTRGHPQPRGRVIARRPGATCMRAEIVFERRGEAETTFYFKHALIQDAAYDSLLRSRRRELHAKIAEAIETRTPDEARMHPELIAHHLSRAGEYRRAVDYGMAAGMTALTRSANAEAIGHTRACLDWLTNLPAGEERDQTELGVNAHADAGADGLPRLRLGGGRGERPSRSGAPRRARRAAGDVREPLGAQGVPSRPLGTDAGARGGGALPGARRAVRGRGPDRRRPDASRAVRLDRRRPCRGRAPRPPRDRPLRSAVHGHHAYVYGFDSLSYSRITLSQVLWITGRSAEALPRPRRRWRTPGRSTTPTPSAWRCST